MTSKGLNRREFLKLAGSASAIPLAALMPPVFAEKLLASPARRQAERVITIATSEGQRADGIRMNLDLIREKTGITVDVQASPEYRTQVAADFVAGGGAYDAIMAPFLFMKDWFVSGYLAPLQPFVDADPEVNIGDFIPALLTAYNWSQDQVYTLPYQADTHLFFFRKDVFEDPDVQAAYKAETGNDLKVPQTVEEQLEVARYFTKRLNPNSPIEYGFTNWSERWGSVWWWGIRMSVLGGGWLDKDNHPAMNNEAGLRALRDYLAMHEFAPEDVTTYDWDRSNTSFLDGRALMFDQWNAFGSIANSTDSTSGASQVVGKVGYALPTGYEVDGKVVNQSILGGWTSAVSAFSDDVEGAYQVLAQVTSRQGELNRIEIGTAPTRQSTYEGLELTQTTEHYPMQAQAFAVSYITADVDAPPISQQVQDFMATQISRVLLREIEPEQALADVESEWTTMLQDAGIYG
ncbi:MAG: extracellular solute-binding protein [Anaerolineae bacterium]|nr:extracellular solute-binding protein [Anaerolineae bacterium]